MDLPTRPESTPHGLDVVRNGLEDGWVGPLGPFRVQPDVGGHPLTADGLRPTGDGVGGFYNDFDLIRPLQGFRQGELGPFRADGHPGDAWGNRVSPAGFEVGR